MDGSLKLITGRERGGKAETRKREEKKGDNWPSVWQISPSKISNGTKERERERDT